MSNIMALNGCTRMSNETCQCDALTACFRGEQADSWTHAPDPKPLSSGRVVTVATLIRTLGTCKTRKRAMKRA